jgi:hypothetical protein
MQTKDEHLDAYRFPRKFGSCLPGPGQADQTRHGQRRGAGKRLASAFTQKRAGGFSVGSLALYRQVDWSACRSSNDTGFFPKPWPASFVSVYNQQSEGVVMLFKKLINSLLGSRSASRTYRRYSSSDYKHGGYHKQPDGRGHGHGHAYYGSAHYKKKHSSSGFFSS